MHARERFNFDRISDPVNCKLNFCELKLNHGDFTDRSKNEVFVDRQSIDR